MCRTSDCADRQTHRGRACDGCEPSSKVRMGLRGKRVRRLPRVVRRVNKLQVRRVAGVDGPVDHHLRRLQGSSSSGSVQQGVAARVAHRRRKPTLRIRRKGGLKLNNVPKPSPRLVFTGNCDFRTAQDFFKPCSERNL